MIQVATLPRCLRSFSLLRAAQPLWEEGGSILGKTQPYRTDGGMAAGANVQTRLPVSLWRAARDNDHFFKTTAAVKISSLNCSPERRSVHTGWQILLKVTLLV